MPEWFNTIVAVPVVVKGLQLLVLGLLFLLAHTIARIVRRQVERRLHSAVLDSDRRLRLQTLHRVGYGATITVLITLSVVMGLQIVGLPIGPLLGSAGVVGLAISLGAQSLIRDYLGGVYILAEDQFRVGDQVTVAGVTGEVVRMTMRVTYLRDLDGKLHTVPNGDIRLISNHTREWARAVVDLNLAYSVNMGAAQQVLQQALNQVALNSDVKDWLVGQPDLVTWNNFSDWAVQVRLMARTLPGKQWQVAQVLRQAAVEGLRQAGFIVAPPMPVWREGE